MFSKDRNSGRKANRKCLRNCEEINCPQLLVPRVQLEGWGKDWKHTHLYPQSPSASEIQISVSCFCVYSFAVDELQLLYNVLHLSWVCLLSCIKCCFINYGWYLLFGLIRRWLCHIAWFSISRMLLCCSSHLFERNCIRYFFITKSWQPSVWYVFALALLRLQSKFICLLTGLTESCGSLKACTCVNFCWWVRNHV